MANACLLTSDRQQADSLLWERLGRSGNELLIAARSSPEEVSRLLPSMCNMYHYDGESLDFRQYGSLSGTVGGCGCVG